MVAFSDPNRTLAVTAALWAWADAQYPHLLNPGLTVSDAAAASTTLQATLISLAVGAVLLLPSLAWLYMLFQRQQGRSSTRGDT